MTLKELRNEKNLTQAQLSKLTGIGQSRISELDNLTDWDPIQIGTVKKISDALEMPIKEFIDKITGRKLKMKQFKNIDEYKKGIVIIVNEILQEKAATTTDELEKWMYTCAGLGYTQTEIAEKLKEKGYNLDDLIADGHAYCIDGHDNNGWKYRDEISPFYIDEFPVERIRERNTYQNKKDVE